MSKVKRKEEVHTGGGTFDKEEEEEDEEEEEAGVRTGEVGAEATLAFK